MSNYLIQKKNYHEEVKPCNTMSNPKNAWRIHFIEIPRYGFVEFRPTIETMPAPPTQGSSHVQQQEISNCLCILFPHFYHGKEDLANFCGRYQKVRGRFLVSPSLRLMSSNCGLRFANVVFVCVEMLEAGKGVADIA